MKMSKMTAPQHTKTNFTLQLLNKTELLQINFYLLAESEYFWILIISLKIRGYDVDDWPFVFEGALLIQFAFIYTKL